MPDIQLSNSPTFTQLRDRVLALETAGGGGGGGGGGDMLKANNLSDLPSKSTARSNLGLTDMATLPAAVPDPDADRIMFWDDSAGGIRWLQLGTNLTITGTTLDAAGGGGSGMSSAAAAQAYGASIQTLGANVDNAAAINAALNTAGVPGVILGPGTFGLSSAIIVPAGKWIIGQGRDNTIVKLLTGFSGGAGNVYNSGICSAQDARNVIVSDLTVDVNKVGNDALANHINGIRMIKAKDFLVERVKVVNVTGYGLHSQGWFGTTPAYCSRGTWRDVITENCNVHIEQTCAEDIVIENFYCSDGDNDCVVESYLHPLEGSRRIRYRNGEVNGSIGAAGVGVSMVNAAATYGVQDVSFEKVKITCRGIGIVLQGNSGANMRATKVVFQDCEIVSTVNIGANLDYADVKLRDTKIGGIVTGFQFGNSTVRAVDVDIVASATGDITAFGYSNNAAAGTGRLDIVRGSVQLTVVSGVKYPLAGADIYPDRGFQIIGEVTNGVRAITAPNNYYADLTDAEKTISLDFAGQNQSVQIYPNSSMPWPIGTRMFVRETTGLSGGAVKQILPQGGVTINSPGALTNLKAHGQVLLEKIGTNTWRMSGDLQ